jgi:hypothetical protein
VQQNSVLKDYERTIFAPPSPALTARDEPAFSEPMRFLKTALITSIAKGFPPISEKGSFT